MNNISINLEYCYGIKKLHHSFDFSNRTFAIYAPNGVMKTSFAKTFYDYSKGEKASDLAFPERHSVIEILADGVALNDSSVFVIESYNASFRSEKISTLLANSQLKEEYERTHKAIDKSKVAFVKKIKQLSGLTGRKDNIEGTIERIFGVDFFQYVSDIEDTISKSAPLPFHNIEYQIIFNDRVKAFLETKDFKVSIQKYIKKYDQLIEDSPYLNNNFKFHHAENIQKQLDSNNFFKGGHSVNLSDGSEKSEYNSDDSFYAALEEEKNKIFSDVGLQKTFTEINEKLTNKELRDFRDYLMDNQELLPELSDLNILEEKIWTAYFVNQKDLFVDLARKYKAGQQQIKTLIDKAKNEQTEWEDVVHIFNTRFSHLPFHLNIKNKADVILKSDVETIEFIFKDGEQKKTYDEQKDLLKILSTGEQRALYLLNIIFEVEARKNDASDSVFIIDDIADSFDYKNKYAIIDYLKHMAEVESFYLIILSHNFDFYRTLQSRGVSTYSQSLIALKNDSGIKLEQIAYLKNPFIKDWKSHLSDHKKLIASIPFVRNIIEYTQGDNNDEYKLLTSVLHYKDNTPSIELHQIKTIFGKTIQDLTIPDKQLNTKLMDLILSTADECLEADEGINLEHKIVLSIAVRLLSERFMFNKIADKDFLAEIDSNQNWVLQKKYEKEFNNEKEPIEILKRVSLITPDNIHVNSFMYEPILDMGDIELRNLYLEVKEKLNI